MIKITVELIEEQIREAFENAEVRFSKAKFKTVKENLEYNDLDIKEQLEERLLELLEEIIADEFEK